MISAQSLEMIHPTLGRERTFGWYPPAHDQFAKVPYKIMAVLDDYSYYKTQDVNSEKEIEDKVDLEPVLDNSGSILSSKLNAIRQDLTRRRINPTVIRQIHSKKFNSVNQYMNIQPNWTPKYPEPNLEIVNNIEHRHSAPVSRENRKSYLEEQILNVKHSEKKIEQNLSDNQAESQNLHSSSLLDFQEFSLAKQKKLNLQRPYTAPGLPLRSSKSKIGSTISSQLRQSSTSKLLRDENSNNNQQFNSKRLTQSTSNIIDTTYEADLAKYKWMMEIPGDPFSIKQPHIPVKQPYFHKIEDCKILPPELRMSKQNCDTFFYNTLPCQSMTFDISPNFTSEKYNAKKNLLRSQGKWNFSSKNFSFVY